MTWKLSIDFEQIGDQDAGWSESYYSNNPTSIQSALTLCSSLASARAACCAVTVNIPWGRVTAEPAGSSMASIISFRRNAQATLSGQIPNVGASLAVVKGLLRLVNTSGGYTKQPFGGMPNVNFGFNGVFLPGFAFGPALGGFINFLATNGFCTRKITQGTAPFPNGGAFQKWPIASISMAGVVTVPGSNFAVGNLVKLGRVPGGFGIRGQWVVATVPAAGQYTFFGFPTLAQAIPLKPSSYAQNIVYAYVPIQGQANPTSQQLLSIITRSSKHNVGRPLVSPTGRRKARPK